MSYIGQTLPADTFQGFVTDTFTGDGTANKTFTLSKTPFNESAILVTIDGVVQEATDDFTVSGTTLTLVGTAPNNSEVNAIHIGGALPIGQAASLDLNGASDQLILDADADTTISADTDDQIDFKAGGTDVMSMTATGLTINDGTTITTADNTDTLTLISTDADANSGPNLLLDRNSSSTANQDALGAITFRGRNDAAENVDYIKLEAVIVDETDGTEDGNFHISNITAGTARKFISVNRADITINEDSQNIDFRVESDAHDSFLFVDASESAFTVGNIGTSNEGLLTLGFPTAGAYGIANNITASSGNLYGQKNTFTGQAPDNTTSLFYGGNDNSAGRFIVYSDGDVVNHDNSYGSISDERIKQDIVDSGSQWDDIKAVKVRKFKKKDDVRQYGDKAWVQLGVIAQELEAAGMDKLIKHADPTNADIASDSSFGTLYEDGDDIPKHHKIGDVKEVKSQVKKVGYSVLYMKAIKALQEAQTRIETLETKVAALEG